MSAGTVLAAEGGKIVSKSRKYRKSKKVGEKTGISKKTETEPKMGVTENVVDSPVSKGNPSLEKTPPRKCSGSELHPKCGRFMAKMHVDSHLACTGVAGLRAPVTLHVTPANHGMMNSGGYIMPVVDLLPPLLYLYPNLTYLRRGRR